jgi:ELWxxDGT repeat protein
MPEGPWGAAKQFVTTGGLIYFQIGRAFDTHDLWRSDGTPAGTYVVAHLQEESVAVPYQGALYFFERDWIWKTDGTVAGTVKTGDLPAELYTLEKAQAGHNGIYLEGLTAAFDDAIWFTDGTTGGTRQLTTPVIFPVAIDTELTPLGAHVYFILDGLWRTDGTVDGTAEVAIPGLDERHVPRNLVAHAGKLYFFTAHYATAYSLRLWRLDGDTPAELAHFPGQDGDSYPPELTPFGGKLFFNVNDGVHGIELWSTDGTADGTALVADLQPGKRSSAPGRLTVAGDRLYFTAATDLHGEELWQSDGTAAGTHLVHDIAPMGRSSSPDQLTVAGDELYFTADDGLRGREVWVLPLAGGGSCQPTDTRFCLRGGRYAVEAMWRDFAGNEGAGRAEQLTADTGWFWFFDPDNVEVVLKVLDGRPLNDHAWTFFGALSSVEYTLMVTDTETGLTRRYVNPSGQLASVADTEAFGPRGASLFAAPQGQPSAPPLVERRQVAASTTCVTTATRLCLLNGRFAVEATWRDFAGNTGIGQATGLTADTGWFWFFDDDNVEVTLKVLDGRSLNDRFWVFYGALSSVEYTLTVTDTVTGEQKLYTNPAGRLASFADVDAF